MTSATADGGQIQSKEFQIATWNVNSLRVRGAQVLEWLRAHSPDVVALQETKMQDPDFPHPEFTAAGYHSVFSGQKTYNGVALLSRHPMTDVVRDIPDYDDPPRRVLAAKVAGLRVINLYVPNGQAPDSEKFVYKRAWLEALTRWLEREAAQHANLVVLGDFNIAPEDRDVHDPAQWAGCVHVSPEERAALQRITGFGLIDAFRQFEQPDKSFSWWDYRQAGFRRNAGLRIDLILVNKPLLPRLTACASTSIRGAWSAPRITRRSSRRSVRSNTPEADARYGKPSPAGHVSPGHCQVPEFFPVARENSGAAARRFTVVPAVARSVCHPTVTQVTPDPSVGFARWSFEYPLPRLAHLVSASFKAHVSAEARRSDYDVTDTVLVSSAPDVRASVEDLFGKVWPGRRFSAFAHVFHDFERMFSGRMPGFFGVDTVYHDQQHTLDITLATARLIAGHEMQVPDAQKFGPERAMLGIVVALFHDVGYLRTTRDTDVPNGAEFTTVHVSRGAAFLKDYLPKIDLGSWAPVAAEIIHYTGYERPFRNIFAPDPRDHKLGHMVGTADLMAQMADRCYLEKCRDRLYAEFVLAGVALPIGENGHVKVRYASGLDLLRQTPKFVFDMRAKRLDGEFNRAYRYLEVLYDGRNPYMESIDRNLEYLQRILRSENWRLLRRQPPVFTGVEDSMATTRTLMLGAIKKVWG